MLFQFEGLDGKPIDTASLAGRLTVLTFIATYDTASQAQARFVSALVHNHVPRINAALVVLEPAENRPLVEAFAAALRISFPVAFADARTIEGHGPFEGLHHVPSVVVLDAEGREVYRHLGLVEESELEAELVRLEGRAAFRR